MIIEIKIDKKSDIESFYENIFGEDYIKKWGHIKKAIYHFYPKLEQRLNEIEDKENIQKIIFEYISELYVKYSSKIELIQKDIQNLFDKNIDNIVEGLCNTMDFQEQNISNITINLSLKPDSTFGTNVINLSVALDVFKNQKKPYLDIFIHEINHIIWNQKIGEIYDKIGKLGVFAHEDLKEIVAPVIMRDDCFKNILQSEYMKNANEKQQLLNISNNGIQYNIVDYFESIYKNMKEKGASFKEIMEVFVKIFLKIEDQIIEKHKIYNEFGFLSKDKDVSLKILKQKGYIDPIILL